MALCLVSQGQQGKSHQLRLLRYILGRLCRNPQCDQITKETKSVVDETIKRMELCFGLARGDCSLASLDTQAYSAFASPCCQVSTSTQAQSWQTPSSCTRTRMAFADHCQSLVRSVSFSQYSIVRGSTIEGIGEHIEEIRLGADTGDSSCDEQGEGYHPQRSLQTHAWSGVSSRHRREKLQKAKTARTNMHRNWGKFLDDSVKRWQQHGEKFTKEDEELANAIDAATSVFQAARTHLEETKEALAEFDNIVEKEIPEVSDEDLMADTTGSIGDGIQEMLTNLTRLRDAQDDIEANAAKKARTEEPPATPAAEGGSALPKAMQPFGGGANRPVGDLPGPLCSGCGRCPIHCCLLEPLHFGG